MIDSKIVIKENSRRNTLILVSSNFKLSGAITRMALLFLFPFTLFLKGIGKGITSLQSGRLG